MNTPRACDETLRVAVIIVFALVFGNLICVGKSAAIPARPTNVTVAPIFLARQDAARIAMLREVMTKLAPLHRHLEKTRPGDWLATHPEAGQTFDQYRVSNPVLPDAKRKIIYIQPLGEMTASQKKIVALTADYMHRFFNLEVKIREPLPLSLIPEKARRIHPEWREPQLLTSYILNSVLKPRLPDDALAMIAFTAEDLWPGEGWNFVFGQASLQGRVGVWSIYRNGNPDKDQESFRLALLRTLKIAVHETGHMLSIAHCTAWRCVMNGSNSLEESDRGVLHLCPECLAKILWATHADPVVRYRKLAEFCRANGLREEGAFFRRSAAALEK